ncbi:General stress protein 69 [Enhygromyxa salina]|uniref:General stress protein 69 n=1 Tax=Enhygromyxa salina TaxID=215803 RepID=A0A2S9XED8_9BACT|nr:aldo/keto reductase [Enhygromyxa salina]PRP91238.1 General stress protein 69 [Enhygromyxa salina]
MKYRTLPRTDLQLSAIGFGCWAIGGKWWGDDVDDARSIAAIRAALDHGINWFDTAPLYGHGHAEELLAEALGSKRHDVIIASKVGVRWKEQLNDHAFSDLSPDHIIEDCECILRRLRIDTIPLLQVHWPCECDTPLEATLEALMALREGGKIRHFGLCNYASRPLTQALAYAPELACLQTPYSMLRREFEFALRDTVAPAGEQTLGVLAYETLCRGLLTGKFGPAPRFPSTDLRHSDDRFREPLLSRAQPLISALRVVGSKLNVPPAALAIAWVLRQPGVSVAIVGAKRPEQVADNVRALELLGREKVWQALAPHIDRTRV